MKRIPVASPDLTGNENAYVSEAIRSTWISSAGKFLERFEADFASLCGSSSALGVCNGTVALHLALLALDVRPGNAAAHLRGAPSIRLALYESNAKARELYRSLGYTYERLDGKQLIGRVDLSPGGEFASRRPECR
jgi:hypothetical protein